MTEAEPEVAAQNVPTRPARLNALIATIDPRDHDPPTSRELAAAASESGDEELSAAWLVALRTSENAETSPAQLAQLAKSLGVVDAGVVEAFLVGDDAELIDDVMSQLELLQAIRDGDLKSLHICGAEVTPASRRALARIIREFAAEGYEPGDSPVDGAAPEQSASREAQTWRAGTRPAPDGAAARPTRTHRLLNRLLGPRRR